MLNTYIVDFNGKKDQQVELTDIQKDFKITEHTQMNEFKQDFIDGEHRNSEFIRLVDRSSLLNSQIFVVE